MHGSFVRLAYRLPDLPDELGNHNAIAGRALLERRHVWPDRLQRVRDCAGGVGRDKAELRFGFGQHGLEAKHRSHLGLGAEQRRHLLIAEEAGKERMVEG